MQQVAAQWAVPMQVNRSLCKLLDLSVEQLLFRTELVVQLPSSRRLPSAMLDLTIANMPVYVKANMFHIKMPLLLWYPA